MTHAVMTMVATRAITPAAIGFGVHRYSIFEPRMLMNVAACKNLSNGVSHAV